MPLGFLIITNGMAPMVTGTKPTRDACRFFRKFGKVFFDGFD